MREARADVDGRAIRDSKCGPRSYHTFSKKAAEYNPYVQYDGSLMRRVAQSGIQPLDPTNQVLRRQTVVRRNQSLSSQSKVQYENIGYKDHKW